MFLAHLDGSISGHPIHYDCLLLLVVALILLHSNHIIDLLLRKELWGKILRHYRLKNLKFRFIALTLVHHWHFINLRRLDVLHHLITHHRSLSSHNMVNHLRLSPLRLEVLLIQLLVVHLTGSYPDILSLQVFHMLKQLLDVIFLFFEVKLDWILD